MARKLPDTNGTAPEPGAPPQETPVNITPERQMVVDMWAMQDEILRLRTENAALQEALAKRPPHDSGLAAPFEPPASYREFVPNITGDGGL